MSEESLSITEEAELFRLGLICGYFTLGDAIQWADSVLARNGDAPLEVVELSVSSSGDVEEAFRHLYPLAVGADTKARTRDLLGLLKLRLGRARSEAQWVARRLVRLAGEVGDSSLESAAHGWDDALYPESRWADPEEVVARMQEELGQYDASRDALKHEV